MIRYETSGLLEEGSGLAGMGESPAVYIYSNVALGCWGAGGGGGCSVCTLGVKYESFPDTSSSSQPAEKTIQRSAGSEKFNMIYIIIIMYCKAARSNIYSWDIIDDCNIMAVLLMWAVDLTGAGCSSLLTRSSPDMPRYNCPGMS